MENKAILYWYWNHRDRICSTWRAINLGTLETALADTKTENKKNGLSMLSQPPNLNTYPETHLTDLPFIGSGRSIYSPRVPDDNGVIKIGKSSRYWMLGNWYKYVHCSNVQACSLTRISQVPAKPNPWTWSRFYPKYIIMIPVFGNLMWILFAGSP